MDGVVRYVVTHVGGSGVRSLTFPSQGRYTYETAEKAQEVLNMFAPELRANLLGDRADSLEVRPVECWPNHFDPKTCWFEA